MKSKPFQILYVEDVPSIQEFVKILVKNRKDIHMTYAFNGLEALNIYKNQTFDLVITDMIMPIMDGFELIENIKQINEKQVFMMVTGLESKEDLVKAIGLRVNYFIEKPIKPAKFLTILDESLSYISALKNAELSSSILEQYKKSIDSSSIVSKTDLAGAITYVNDNFCEISKYSREELIGKNHDILKSNQMSDGFFKSMWGTISNKQRWNGVIRNVDKFGNTYVVDTIVVPLLDTENNILEYISISHDITELELYKEDLQKQLDIAVQDIVDTQKEVVSTMGAIGETRSKETGNHVKRVAKYSYLLAKLVGLSEEEAKLLELASPMHDIGKVGIPDSILNKPGKLTPEEFEIMKTHSELGYEMLKSSNREILRSSAIVAHEHHEKWDGSGYPRALSGENIHIYGRITSICDVFDALGSDRCYKKAWPLENILNLLQEEKGKHFDPELIDLMLANLDDFLYIRETLKDDF